MIPQEEHGHRVSSKQTILVEADYMSVESTSEEIFEVLLAVQK
jgi:hypothetical protein